MNIDLSKSLLSMTLGDLKDIIKSVLDERAAEDVANTSAKKYVYGIAGIRDLFGCSDSTALRIKKSGVIDDAITQQGKTIVVDAEYALALVKASKWRNASSLTKVNGKPSSS